MATAYGSWVPSGWYRFEGEANYSTWDGGDYLNVYVEDIVCITKTIAANTNQWSATINWNGSSQTASGISVNKAAGAEYKKVMLSGTRQFYKSTSAYNITIKATVTCTGTGNTVEGSNAWAATSGPTITITVPALASYAVKYNANGGSGAPGSQTKWYNRDLTLSTTKPTRTGYTFNGWSGSDGSSYAAGATYSGNGALTLTAKWTATNYTVSYNANGGSGAPGSQTCAYGSSITLSSTKPTRTGYTFKGWSTSSSASSASYSAGGSYKQSSASNVTLYAVWSVNTYTVSYNANGGSGAPGSQTCAYGSSITLSSTKPTRTDYTFKGWSTSSSASSASYSAGGSYKQSSASNVTLYAVWAYSYTQPRITGFKAFRCDSAGTANDEGAYISVSASWATDHACTGVAITVAGASAYSASPGGTSGTVGQVLGGSYSSETSYAVVLKVSDSSGSTSASATIPTATFIIDFYPGSGVAVGGVAQSGRFDVNLPAYLNKAVKLSGVLSFNAMDSNRRDSVKNFITLGTEPISSAANDTVTNWIALGTGVAWYKTAGKLTGQPTQYGYLINIVGIGDVHQLFWGNGSNAIYKRAGYSGYTGSTNGFTTSWIKIYDAHETVPTATALTTSAGNYINPVYFSGGKPVACSMSASGNRRGVIPYVDTNGCLEVGNLIDFHFSDGDTSDYGARISANSSHFYMTKSLDVSGGGTGMTAATKISTTSSISGIAIVAYQFGKVVVLRVHSTASLSALSLTSAATKIGTVASKPQADETVVFGVSGGAWLQCIVGTDGAISVYHVYGSGTIKPTSINANFAYTTA